MDLRRIKAILRQEYYVTIHSYEVILDIFLSPLLMFVMFGFLSLYLAGSNQVHGAHVLMGALLWELVFIAQYSISMSSLWNIWSHNLSNLFITPLTVREFMFTCVVSAIAKALVIFIPGSVISIYLFNFNLFSIGPLALLLVALNLFTFAMSLGIIILGLIFRFGTRIQAFAWGLLPVFQPISAAFYPLEVLPGVLQPISKVLPPTYSFEAARWSHKYGEIRWDYLGISALENIILLSFAFFFFIYMFNKSRESGQFARNEG